MYQLVYTSEAKESFSADDLEKLLKHARTKNKINGITGMLVFCDNQFLQVLEGPPSAVISTYDRIAGDRRHEDIIVLHRGYSDVGKSFTENAMGFHSLALKEDLPDGFSRVNGRIALYQFDGLAALEFLMACCPKPALIQD